jgi:hypothetical protein
MEAATQAAEHIMALHITQTTRNLYKQRMNVVIFFVRRHFPDSYDQTDIKLRLPLPRDVLEAFFGDLSMAQDGKLKAFTTITGYKSAISDYYKEHGNLVMDASTERWMSQFMAGYKRRVAQAKQDGEMDIMEGKAPLPKNAYRQLALRALTADHDWLLNIFAWSFLLNLWNLVARSKTVGSLMYAHYAWGEDCIVITVPKQKGDQDGHAVYAKHLYANPLDPTICPILAHGVHLLCCPFRSTNAKPQVYLGQESERRFSRWLQTLIKQMSIEDIESLQLGCSEKYLGTHSPRKGCPSYCAAMPGGPSPVSIYLRAGWSLGQIQHRYIFAGQGGDQFVGRTAVGLPLMDSEFSVLPPHFSNTQVMSQVMLDMIVPGYTLKLCQDYLTMLLLMVRYL